MDAVTISTPDHTHGVIASNAMNRGLHVYVQKPLTHNIEEARMLTEIAAKNKVVTQMGNQGGSSQGVTKIQEWVDKKLIGKQYPDISFAIEKQRLRFFSKSNISDKSNLF